MILMAALLVILNVVYFIAGDWSYQVFAWGLFYGVPLGLLVDYLEVE